MRILKHNRSFYYINATCQRRFHAKRLSPLINPANWNPLLVYHILCRKTKRNGTISGMMSPHFRENHNLHFFSSRRKSASPWVRRCRSRECASKRRMLRLRIARDRPILSVYIRYPVYEMKAPYGSSGPTEFLR